MDVVKTTIQLEPQTYNKVRSTSADDEKSRLGSDAASIATRA